MVVEGHHGTRYPVVFRPLMAVARKSARRNAQKDEQRERRDAAEGTTGSHLLTMARLLARVNTANSSVRRAYDLKLSAPVFTGSCAPTNAEAIQAHPTRTRPAHVPGDDCETELAAEFRR
jgi:hypothetical protein